MIAHSMIKLLCNGSESLRLQKRPHSKHSATTFTDPLRSTDRYLPIMKPTDTCDS